MLYKGVDVRPGSKLHELLQSKDKKDQKTAARLFEFTQKCAEVFYNYEEVRKLREEYKDVV